MPSPYFSWWLAGLGLGALAVTQWLVDRRPLGVSKFVECSVRALRPGRSDTAAKRDGAALRAVVSARASILFIIAVALGGAIAAWQRGTWSLATTLGPRFEALWGDGALAVVALFGGGLLVGFGTRMADGCTSGHGLSGCSRLQVGSLVATATFLATAVALTFVVRGGS